MADPQRANDLTEIEDPIWQNESTEMLLAKLTDPNTLAVEPNLVNALTERELANLVEPLTERELPRFANSRTLTALPMRE